MLQSGIHEVAKVLSFVWDIFHLKALRVYGRAEKLHGGLGKKSFLWVTLTRVLRFPRRWERQVQIKLSGIPTHRVRLDVTFGSIQRPYFIQQCRPRWRRAQSRNQALKSVALQCASKDALTQLIAVYRFNCERLGCHVKSDDSLQLPATITPGGDNGPNFRCPTWMTSI